MKMTLFWYLYSFVSFGEKEKLGKIRESGRERCLCLPFPFVTAQLYTANCAPANYARRHLYAGQLTNFKL